MQLPDGENWRPVRGYAGWYEVSDAGNVWSMARAATAGGLLTVQLSPKGYRVVILCRYGRIRIAPVGRLVLEAFVRPPALGERARHRGARDDDRLSQLYWG
jgi:hypothetical protein